MGKKTPPRALPGKDWVAEFKNKNRRALARLISMAENQDPAIPTILSQLFDRTGHAHVIGITGPPGAGKSTLTSHFIKYLREHGKTVAVLAVDPVNPFTGGSLLGDRIRLTDHFNDEHVFIRSLSTRGKLGGLSLAARESVHLLDAFGFDYLILETVGVGQSEIDVRKSVDLTMVVLHPEWGDTIQTLKSGLLDIADLFVINKSDRDGAEKLLAELQTSLALEGRESIPVLASSIHNQSQIEKLFVTLQEMLHEKQDEIKQRRKASLQSTAAELIERHLWLSAQAWTAKQVKKTQNPYRFLNDFLKRTPLKKVFQS